MKPINHETNYNPDESPIDALIRGGRDAYFANKLGREDDNEIADRVHDACERDRDPIGDD